LARKHDETYKLIFSQRAAVEELVRNFVGEDLADDLDFHTLEALPTDRISGGLVQRRVDLLWKIRFRGTWLYLLVLLERWLCGWRVPGKRGRFPRRSWRGCRHRWRMRGCSRESRRCGSRFTAMVSGRV